MRPLLFILTTPFTIQTFAQKTKAQDFGFKYLQTIYKGDTVDILVKSKKGEEKTKANNKNEVEGKLELSQAIGIKIDKL
jgi:hypothetical protein